MTEAMMADWDGRGLVSTTWLADHLADPELRVFDATVHLRPSAEGPYRIESGRSDYSMAHIPGAAFADLAGDFSDGGAPLPFTLPEPSALGRRLGEAGIGAGSRVIVCSTTSPMWATRLWWMLRSCGFDFAAVLDGGMAKWRTEGRPIESGARSYPTSTFPLTFRAGCWTDKAGVLAAIGDDGVCTIVATAGPTMADADISPAAGICPTRLCSNPMDAGSATKTCEPCSNLLER